MPRIALTLKEKIEVIEHHKREKCSVRKLAKHWNIGKTQAADIIKNRENLMNIWCKNGNYRRYRMFSETNPGYLIDKCVFEWFSEVRNNQILVSGPMLQTKALEVAKCLGRMDFKASNGWLQRFRKRHMISFKTINGKSATMDLRETAAKAIASADGASTSFLPSYDSVKSTLYKEKQRLQNKEEKSSSSASEQNNEGPNPLPVENEENSATDVEMQCSQSTEMEMQSAASTSFMSNADIVFKQEIIETEQESSTFDDYSFHSSLVDGPFETQVDGHRLSTSYQALFESPNSITGYILPDGQANVVAIAPTLSHHDLKTMKVESDVSVDSHDVIVGTNGVFSNEPSTLNVTVPKISPSNEPFQTVVSSHAESTSMPQVLDGACHGDSYNDESTQTEALTPPRDKFDVFGEFVASKLRNLDPKSSAFVQTAFSDLITKAEFGMFLNRNEISISSAPIDSIQKYTALYNESQITHASSGKENIQPVISSLMGYRDFSILSRERSLRNETAQSKVLPHKAHPSFHPVINIVGPENSARNEPSQPRITSHIENLQPLVVSLTVPESTSSYSSNQLKVSPRIVSPAFPPDLNCVSSSSNKPSHPRAPFRMRPRDEFDVYGELTLLQNYET